MQLAGLFAERERSRFLPFLPDFTYSMLDLCRTPEEELRGEVLRHLTLVWLKRGHQDGFWQHLPDYLATLKELRDSTGGLGDIEPLLRYLVSANPRKIPEDIKRTLGQFAPQTEEWWMTWAEQLREEGRLEERKRAEEISRLAEEHKQARLRLLGKMRQRMLSALRRKFGDLPEEIAHRVEAATEEQLDDIEAHLDDAYPLDEILRMGTERESS